MNISLKDKRVSTMLHLSRKAFAGYKWQISLLALLGFISGILEGIGVNALIPLFSFAVGDGSGAKDPISQFIEKFFDALHIQFSVFYLLLFIAVLFVGKALVLIYLDYIKLKISHDYEQRLRQRVFSSIMNTSWPHLLKQKLGHLETILLVDIQRGATLLKQLSSGIIVATSLLIYIIIAVNISFIITNITLLVGAISFLFLKPLVFKSKVIAQEAERLNKESAHFASENISGMKTIKSMAVENKIIETGKNYFVHQKELEIKRNILKTITTSFLQPVAIIFICILFAFTYNSPGFNLAALVAVVYLIHKIFTYIQQTQRTIQEAVNLAPHLSAALYYEQNALDMKELDEGKKRFSFEKELSLDHVSFQYNSDKKVLRDVTFTIKKGEMVGLIGPSGVGKTTIVDIILRLLQPSSGKLFVDGCESTEIGMHAWRKNIGYVSQDIFLINDTIANNISFYDPSITKQRMIEVAKQANIYDFIEKSPKGFNTLIGERGIQLSAGQRQRIVIARVLARSPKILILDEATSALDNTSEAKIQHVIESLKGKITVLVIAHRLSTVMDSDKLLVVEDGKIQEQGAPQKLLKDKSSYFFKVFNIRK